MKLNQREYIPYLQTSRETDNVDANLLADQFQELFKKLDTMQKQLNNLEESLVEKIQD